MNMYCFTNCHRQSLIHLINIVKPFLLYFKATNVLLNLFGGQAHFPFGHGLRHGLPKIRFYRITDRDSIVIYAQKNMGYNGTFSYFNRS